MFSLLPSPPHPHASLAPSLASSLLPPSPLLPPSSPARTSSTSSSVTWTRRSKWLACMPCWRLTSSEVSRGSLRKLKLLLLLLLLLLGQGVAHLLSSPSLECS